jgi:hypothetical protein
MADLVTADEARDHLRLDNDSNGGPDGPWLALWIPVVSEAVASWLKDDWRLWVSEVDSNGNPILDSNGDPIPALDSNGDPTPRWRVKGAVLMELSSLYRFREGEGKDNVVPADAGYGYVLNKTSTALLSSLRRPTVS